jgi:hypothetical protein
MHGSWAATGHTSVGQALRCFSVGPCHACRRGRFRRLLGLSKVRAGRLGNWRRHCSNTDRYSGALDDRRARRFGDGCDNRTMYAAAVRTPKRAAISASRTPPTGSTEHAFCRKILPSSSNGQGDVSDDGRVREFERSMIRERVNAGIARAKAEGKRLRSPLHRYQVGRARIRQALAAPGRPGVHKLAKQFGVGSGTHPAHCQLR